MTDWTAILGLIWAFLFIFSPVLGVAFGYFFFYRIVKTGEDLGLIMCGFAMLFPIADIIITLLILAS